MKVRCFFKVVITACFLSVAVPASGAGEGETTEVEQEDGKEIKSVILLVPGSGEEERSEVHRAVSGQFGDSPVRVRFVEVEKITRLPFPQLVLSRKLSSERNVIGVFWYDYLPDGQGNLFIYQPRRDRLLIRDVSGLVPEERWEALGVIMRSTSDALSKGVELGKVWKAAAHEGQNVTEQTGGMEKEEAQPPAPEETTVMETEEKSVQPPPSEESRAQSGEGGPLVAGKTVFGVRRSWGVGMDVGYQLDGYSTDAGATHGLYAGVSVRFLSRWAIVADYRVQQRITGSAGAITTDLNRHPIGLGIRHTWRKGRYAIDCRLSVIMDYATYNTRTDRGTGADPDVSDNPVDPVENPVDPVENPVDTPENNNSVKPFHAEKGGLLLWHVGAFARGLIKVAGPLSVFVSIGLQVPLNPHRYVAETEGANRIVLIEAWPVQPMFVAGVTAEVF